MAPCCSTIKCFTEIWSPRKKGIKPGAWTYGSPAPWISFSKISKWYLKVSKKQNKNLDVDNNRIY
jgi:hypothetical protein